MNLLLTGLSGLLGNAIAQAATRRGHSLTGIHHQHPPHYTHPKLTPRVLDLTDHHAVQRLTLDLFPDAILHTAALSSPADCDRDPALARHLNVTVPTQLAQLAHHLNAPLLHVSSDMVFDGQGGPYRSTDTPQPTHLYGRLKLEAEIQVLQYGGPRATVLRVPILTGDSPRGQRSLHEKLFSQWAQGQTTPLYTDEIRQPCSASNLADVMIELVERTDLHGLFHWAGSEALSRYEMGTRLLQHFNLPTHLITAATLPPARPKNLTLQTHPLLGKLKTQPETFAQQLELMSVPPPCRAWYHQL